MNPSLETSLPSAGKFLDLWFQTYFWIYQRPILTVSHFTSPHPSCRGPQTLDAGLGTLMPGQTSHCGARARAVVQGVEVMQINP